MKISLSNKAYDITKWFAQIGLPAFATLYFTLAQIWSLPNGSEIVGSITAVDACLGVMLGLSSKSYNSSDAKYDGTMHIQTREDGKTFKLELGAEPDDLEKKNELVFKVNNT